MTNALRIVPAGDAALLVELAARIDPEISARAVVLERAVRVGCGPGIRDVVVGYCSVTVYFDPLQVDAAWLESEIRRVAATADGWPAPDLGPAPARLAGRDSSPARRVRVDASGEPVRKLADPSIADASAGAVLDIPVCYDTDLGPDLADVAAFAGATVDEVIALHTGTTYRVYVVGFMPGFAYMASVDPRLAIPRRTTPRTSVPAGSVAIAAGQTGIYPTETPGGWHLLGRTSLKPYDASRPEPFLFKPGDRVRFRPIGRHQFEAEA